MFVCVCVCECESVCVHVHACVNVRVCLREAREGVGFLELQLLAVVSCKMQDLGNKLGYGARVPTLLAAQLSLQPRNRQFYLVMGTEPRASCMPGSHSAS